MMGRGEWRPVANGTRGTAFLAVAAMVALAGASPSLAHDMAAAKQNYELFCANCHGPGGKGDGPAGTALNTKPRDFTDCARMAKYSDEELFTAIKEGGEAVGLSKDMPPWKAGLADEDIHGLVALVRGFCANQVEPTAPKKPAEDTGEQGAR